MVIITQLKGSALEEEYVYSGNCMRFLLEDRRTLGLWGSLSFVKSLISTGRRPLMLEDRRTRKFPGLHCVSVH